MQHHEAQGLMTYDTTTYRRAPVRRSMQPRRPGSNLAEILFIGCTEHTAECTPCLCPAMFGT